MSKRAARLSRLAVPAALALLALFAPAGAGAAQGSPATSGALEITPPVRAVLRQLDERWLEWIVLKDAEQSEASVKSMLDEARAFGMTRLPDFAGGALNLAAQMARKKDFERAGWALAAAEQLDPGRPETAFAESTVDALRGRYPAAVLHRLRAYPRIFFQPLERFLLLQSLAIWILAVVAVVGALFIALQMASNGSALFHDLASFLGRKLPRGAALVLTLAAFLWPAALPHGFVWLVLYWSVLLWGYASTSERIVLVCLWLFVGCAPLAVHEQRQRVAVAISPPAIALENLQERRLYGGLFSDLGVLRSLLPESVAVKQLLADFHRSLNQWDAARSLYRQVLDADPKNTASLLNLGVYAFNRGEFSDAIELFKKAADQDRQSAAAYFNLSQAYSESYQFDDKNRAVAQARAIDNAQVSAWLNNPQQRVVAVPGGMERIGAIRGELSARWNRQRSQPDDVERFRRGLSIFLSLSLILLAGALHLARRPFGYSVQAFDLIGRESLVPWFRALVPGLASAEVGEGWKTFGGLLIPVGLCLLPAFGVIGYRIPWRYDPGNLGAWIVAIAGLTLYFGVRLKRELGAA